MNTNNNRINGTVTGISGAPIANLCFIKGDNGRDYFAHIGDLEANENILYKLLEGKMLDPQTDKPETFLKNDQVNFIAIHNTSVNGKGRAITIRKINP
jgi:hypothetical protein